MKAHVWVVEKEGGGRWKPVRGEAHLTRDTARYRMKYCRGMAQAWFGDCSGFRVRKYIREEP